MEIKDSDALIVVDVQNDFCPGGALAVPNGDLVVPLINDAMPFFTHVLATQDFHPPNHSSFKEQGGPWPPHCVQGTPGADFHPGLDVDRIDEVIQKGQDTDTDGYSGFAGTNLEDRLWDLGVTRVFVCGLATDYCVRATAIEAVAKGFDTVVLIDAIRAVDVERNDGELAVEEMAEAGAALEDAAGLHS